jgi:acetylornithine deacetylase/succinyl-diaminopimelate desuccinylase-like protein
MLEFLKNFTLRFQNPTSNKWETSYNISSINTLNSAYNKIPDMCSVKIDIRFVPDHEKTIKQVIQDILLVNCSLKEYAFEPCFQTDKHNENIIELQKLVEKYSTYKSKLY